MKVIDGKDVIIDECHFLQTVHVPWKVMRSLIPTALLWALWWMMEPFVPTTLAAVS